jgi:hypothetical protein
MTTDDSTGRFLLLADQRRWSPADGDEPPVEAVAGLWPVHPDGSAGRFRSNPDYSPGAPEESTDPLDAVLRRLARREVPVARLQLLLRETLVDLALDSDGGPLLTATPDAVTCVMVATGGTHAERIGAPQMLRLRVEEVAALLPEDADVLVNPGGLAAARLERAFWCATAEMSPNEVAAARAAAGDVRAEPSDGEADGGRQRSR